MAMAIGAHLLGLLLGAALSHYFFAALIGSSAFLYVPIALERDHVGMVGNLLFGGVIFVLAVMALNLSSLFLAGLFLTQGIWSGWVAGLRQPESAPADPLWVWSVFNLTLGVLV